MSQATPTLPSIAEVQKKLGGIPLDRICLDPPPGTATEEDMLEATRKDGAIYELAYGTLTRKPMGFYEGLVEVELITILNTFVKSNKLGKVAPPDGMMKIIPGQIRYPDVAYISWERMRKAKIRGVPAPRIAPELAIEVLSPSNTPEEIDSKIREYFQGGVQLVWVINPETETAVAYTAADKATKVDADGTLYGGNILPGFELHLSDLFEDLEADRED